MDTIDDIGRRAAAALRAETDALADADAGLAAVAAAAAHPVRSNRRWAVFGAAAAVVLAVGAGALVFANREAPTEVIPSPSVPPSPVPTDPPSSTSTTVATPTPSSAPPSTVAELPARPPATGDGLAVSYKDPPPFLEPQLLANVEMSDAEIGGGIVVMETGVVVVDGRTATIVGWDGARRTVDLQIDFEFAGWITLGAGPGDILYAAATGVDRTNLTEATIVAVPLSGDRSGQVVATTPSDVNRMIERPAGTIGHGPTGLVDRIGRIPGVIAEYVDDRGEPWPTELRIGQYRKDGDVVSSIDGEQSWPLNIERSAGSGDSYNGAAGPSPAPGGGAVWWDLIGPRGSNSDFTVGTMEVIAFLAPDGSAMWRRVPTGWRVASADVWGIVVARQTGTTLELALATTAAAATPAPTAAEQAVTDYLTALAARDYQAAAELVGADGLSPSAGPNFSVIRDSVGPDNDMAAALQGWCESERYGVACWMPTSVAEAEPNALDTGDSTIVIARYEDSGGGFSATFRVGAWEGQPTVYGLPPLTVDELPALREFVEVDAIYAYDSGDRRLAMASTTGADTIGGPPDGSGPISVTPDGYAISWAADEQERTTVTDTNEAVLCVIDEPIAQLLGEPGDLQAIVVRDGEVGPPTDPTPQPSFRIDCQTGSETPTDPWAWNGGPTFRTRMRVGERDYFVSGSDHGSQIEDSAGTLLSDADSIVTSPSFSNDGSVITYGATAGSADPWLATRVVARDTRTGQQLWATDVGAPVNRTWTTGDRIVVELGVTSNPLDGTAALAVLDAATGAMQLTVPAAVNLVHVR